MSDSIDHDRVEQHTLADWLDLHGLDVETCRHLLDVARQEAAEISGSARKPDEPPGTLDPDQAWTIVTSAISKFLAVRPDIVEETFERSEKIAVVGSQNSRRALTIDHGPEKFPTIIYSFSGIPSDLLVVAHEFGHALQIRASGGKFMAPIVRETCAFLSEATVLSYCRHHDVAPIDILVDKWQQDNHRYLGRLADKLRDALGNTGAIYQYGWNYPIARLLALRIFADFQQNSLWQVFTGDCTTKGILERLAV